jgi:hypothetical protein
MEKINYCKSCGKIIDKFGSKKYQLCSKHFQQFIKFGKILDNNQRTIKDPNEIRTYNDYAEVDTYDQYGNIIETYKIDLEDIKYLKDYKWRTVYKGKAKLPYLVTSHTIYFHRLIMGLPNCEIDHINRDTHDNRKNNLRFATRQEQLYNTLKSNKTGIKGLYYNPNRPKAPWHCEFQYNNKKYYSPQCKTKEEAAYFRYLFENIFMKDMVICNTKELQECISNLSEENKISIQKYFRNKMKI